MDRRQQTSDLFARSVDADEGARHELLDDELRVRPEPQQRKQALGRVQVRNRSFCHHLGIRIDVMKVTRQIFVGDSLFQLILIEIVEIEQREVVRLLHARETDIGMTFEQTGKRRRSAPRRSNDAGEALRRPFRKGRCGGRHVPLLEGI